MSAVRLASYGALLAGVITGRANAQAIYQQWPHLNPGVASAGAPGQTPEVRAADEFVIPEATVIGGIRWVGHTPTPEQIAGFLVEIRRDDADGIPAGDAVLSAAVPVDRTGPNSLGPNGDAENFEHTHWFAPLAIEAGTYYVSIGAITFDALTEGWRWNRTSAPWNFLSWIETTIFTGFVPINPLDLTFQILAPANADACGEAAAIFAGDTPFDSTDATTDGPTHAACTDDGQIHADLWFRYTAQCDGLLQVSTCDAADFDTVIAVYVDDGCPANAKSLLLCNDDGPSCADGGSVVLTGVTAGQSYLIRVGGATPEAKGTGTLTLTEITGVTSELLLALPTAPVGFGEGETIAMTLSMTNLCEPVGGYRASLVFDPTAVSFEGGQYTADPFGLHVPLTSRVTGEVDLSALVDPASGQTPTGTDAVLAVLSFTTLRPLCLAPVAFADTGEPSRLLDPNGVALPAQTLVVSPPSSGLLADINRDGAVDVDDLLQVILQWGPCEMPGASCTADLDCSGSVAVDDLVTVILGWTV